MHKNFSAYCPAKEKIVSLNVNYISAGTFEDDRPVHIKGRINSCSGNDANCDKCKLYDALPEKI